MHHRSTLSRKPWRAVALLAFVALLAALPDRGSAQTAAQMRTAPALQLPGAGTLENNTNRYGSDYRGFETASPQQCQSTCAAEGQCRAWTWVRPGIQSRTGNCWLKSAEPAAKADACCISGVPARAAAGNGDMGIRMAAPRTAAAARLIGRGLDPNDPALETKLQALAVQAGTGLATHGAAVRSTIVTPQSRVNRPLPPAGNTAPPPAATPEPPQLPQAGPNAPLRLTRFGPVAGGYEIPDWNTVVPRNGIEQYRVMGHLGRVDTAELVLDLGTCGQVAFAHDPSRPGEKFFLPKPVPGPASYQASAFVRNGKEVSARIPATVYGDVQNIVVTVPVTAKSPHLASPGGIGLSAQNVFTAPGTRLSTTPDYRGGKGGSGVDVFGDRMNLLNGFSATARIVKARSYLDGPGYEAPMDAARGARIVLQPQGGRLNTRVEWFHAAGESIDYVIEWTFSGPLGMRPLATMSKQGHCGA
ncbi:MAG: PAN domain-containing protein [Rubrivivax sp.]|nr:PAN domain-containing protein [Rubrivivax sp.]